MSNKIDLTIDGEGVSPETVPISDLIHILSQLSSALKATAESRGSRSGDVHISLVDIRGGSDVLTFATDENTHRFAEAIVESIATGDASDLPIAARRGLRGIWKRLHAKQWNATLSRNGQGSAVRILHDKPLFGSSTTTGNTSVVAYVVRAGGDDPTASIRLQTGEKLTAVVSTRDLAQKIGTLLYKHVELVGEAVWTTSDWKMLKFRITGIGPYIQENSEPIESLDKLSSLSGGLWDSIDPDEYISDLRAE